MRKIAKDKNGQWCHADQAKLKQIYYDEHGAELVVKRNKYQMFFIRKKGRSTATLSEGDEHIRGKKLLQNLYQNQLQEEYKVSSKQRADLFLAPDYVFEIQCSPISFRQLKERHQNYQQLKLKDQWIIGHKIQQKQQLALMFCEYDPCVGFYYFALKKNATEIKRCIWKVPYKPQNIAKLAYKFRYHQGWPKRLKELWYLQKLKVEDYLLYLNLPVHVPCLAPYDEYLLKSQILWSLLHKPVLGKYQHRFVFLDCNLYLRIFQSDYYKQIFKYLA